MKRLVSLLLTISLLLSLLPTASIAECSHKNLSFEYDPQYSYEAIDDVYHSVTIDLYYKCDDCGERVRETQQGNNAKHRFNSRGVCEACSYEEETEAECSHKNLSLEYDPQYSYEELNDTYHSVITDLYYKCDDCGERIHETEKGGKAKHWFNSRGVCKDCGYEEEVEEDCSHKNLSLEYDPQYSYEAIDDVYHSVTVDLYYKCDDCGERVHKTQDSGSVKHHFEYGECVQCHYKELWTEAPILEPTPRPSLMPIETDIPQPTEVVTPVPTVIPTEVVTPVPTRVPTAVPTEVVTLAPTRVPTAIPTEVVTPAPTKVPTAVPTQVITPAPTNTVAPKPTEIATIEPTATVHVCKAGKPSHWYGVYEYYDENSHTRHHVTTTYCTVCGKELSKTNELEYVEHVFEKDTCTKCGWKCTHTSTNSELTNEVVGYDYAGRESHVVQYLQREICNKCGQVIKTWKQGKKTESHTFANGYCVYCNGEEPLFLQDELPTGRYINEELDGRLDYFIENLSDRGAQSILERLIKEIEVMENSKKGTQLYADAKENALGLMYQLKMSFEYQCDVRISDAYKPYHDFMTFVDQWKLMKYVGIYGEIETDPGFCTMVDVALNSYEISSETFKAALAYAKTFNSTFTYDMIGVVDIGIASGLIAETIATGGVSRIRTIEDAQKLMDKDGSFTKNAAEHIFGGNKSGGFHYEGLNNSSSKVVEVIEKYPNGTYRCNVSINGKVKPSSFFPKNWTPEQVINSIKNVCKTGQYNPIDNSIKGSFKGIDIRIFLNEAGKVVSAFPVVP